MNVISIEAQKRNELGQKSAKELRRSEVVPCVLYGGDDVVHFSAPSKSFKSVVYTPDFNVVELSIDGATFKCVLKDIQFHPVTDKILHIDFMQLVDDKKVVVELPLEFNGLAEGVKAGGKLLPQLRKLRVKALPKDLKPVLPVDVTELQLGKSVKVRELNFDGLEIMNSGGSPIVSIEIPRSLRSKQSAEEGEEEVAAEA
ncbi:UNVERIFIED_CONTAM: hypothetical protein GTU68_013441 [Idotea baltica]|nr:hypothetical protein [Idotea baltica]